MASGAPLEDELDNENRNELRRMGRTGGRYVFAGVALAVGAYLTSGMRRRALAFLSALALLAAAWIGVWALALTLLLRIVRRPR